MSYILDALRKSEQERQIASGHGVGMLYPTMVEPAANNKLKLALLGAAVVAAALVTIWWAASRNPPAPAPGGNNQAVIPGASGSQPEIARPPLPAALPPGEARLAPARPIAERKTSSSLSAAPAASGKPLAEAQPKKASSTNPVAQAAAPPAMPGSKNEALGDSPKGLPTISISGFINDEQGANLAIINDRLVREGEEIAPGLRLEKIIGENAVFNYKGQRFRR